VRKLVEDQEGVGRGQEGPEEVGKAMGEGGRSGRTWESNGTLQSPCLCISRVYVTFCWLSMSDLSDYLALFVHFQAVCDLLLIEHG